MGLALKGLVGWGLLLLSASEYEKIKIKFPNTLTQCFTKSDHKLTAKPSKRSQTRSGDVT